MGIEDWVLKGTNLITNTQKQRFKIQSRGWIFKNTILKKRKEKTKSQKLFKIYIYRYKIDDKYQKAKIKNLEQSLEFQKYNVKEKKKKKKERKKKSQKL